MRPLVPCALALLVTACGATASTLDATTPADVTLPVDAADVATGPDVTPPSDTPPFDTLPSDAGVCGARPDAFRACYAGTPGHACVQGAATVPSCRDGVWSCPTGTAAAGDCGCFGDIAGAACGACTGAAPRDCVAGTPGGTCGDVVGPRACGGSAWVCPAGQVPLAECACAGRPPGSGCTCVAGAWSCPDAGADAGADAGTDAGAACATDVIRMIPPGTGFHAGSYCDELVLCARDASAAAALAGAAPRFACAPETTSGTLACAAGEQRCQWHDASGGSGVMVGAAELDAVCRALALPAGARAGLCVVFE